ncbi:MAG: lipase family protein [Pseudomonadota bacterium]
MPRKAMPRSLSFKDLFLPQPDYPYFEDTDLVSIVAAEGFSPRRAWWLAELSLLAYLEPAQARPHLARLNLDQRVFIDRDATQGWWLGGADWAVVAFRGTEIEERDDLMTDADAWLHRLAPGAGAVHRGFHHALESVWPDLESLAANPNIRRIWTTGHSLGGALALLAARRFTQPAEVVTFGCPRVGDRAFARAFRPRHYRVVYRNDMVPMVPPPGIYKHAGEFIYLDGNQQVHRDMDGWERAKDRARGHARHLRMLFRAWRRGRFESIFSANLADHSPVRYAVALWNASQG